MPKPRIHLTRLHGVFAPDSAHRAQVTKAGQGKSATAHTSAQTPPHSPPERRTGMTWAQRLERVFGIDIATCSVCGGAMRIIACSENPMVIEKILAHLNAKSDAGQASRPSPCRAPPARASD